MASAPRPAEVFGDLTSGKLRVALTDLARTWMVERPTLGVPLGWRHRAEKPSYTSISGPLWPIGILIAVVDTSTNALDKFEEREYHPQTIALPTGDISTLDFGISNQQKQFLYDSGYQAAKAVFAGNPTGVNPYGAIPASVGARGPT